MIKQSRIILMDLTRQIVHESWKGNYSMLFENSDEDADIQGPHSFTAYSQQENSVCEALEPYNSSFSIINEQYICYEAEGPVCIVKGAYEILKDGYRHDQHLKAVWQQKGKQSKIIDFDVSEKKEPSVLPELNSINYFVCTESNGIMHMIPKSEIIEVVSNRNYVDLYRKNEKFPYHIRTTLHNFLTELNDERFFIFSRSRIINLQAIDKITEDTLVMINGNEHPISIKSRTEIRSRLRDFANRKP